MTLVMLDTSILLALSPLAIGMRGSAPSAKAAESVRIFGLVTEEVLSTSWSIVAKLNRVPDLLILRALLVRAKPAALVAVDDDLIGDKYFGIPPGLEDACVLTLCSGSFCSVPVESASAIAGGNAEALLLGRKAGSNLPSIARLAFLDFLEEGSLVAEDLCRVRTLCLTRFRVRGSMPHVSMRWRMLRKGAWGSAHT